jgi:peptidoglycan/LPS O-acetylase OafA/YrhL
MAFQPMGLFGMGVDLFFLISGFIMVLTTRSCDGSPAYAARFLAKRFARIWPIYAIATLVYGAVEWQGTDTLVRALEGLLFIPHDPLHAPLYFQMAVGVSWTLCFEFCFYVVFAASMLFGRFRYLALAAWFAITLIVVPAAQGALNFVVISPREVLGLRYTALALNPIVADFVLGMLVAWVYQSPLRIGSRSRIGALTAASLLTVALGWHALGLMSFHGPRGWGLLMALVFLGAMFSAKARPLRVPAWTAWLGDISYSLYLFHPLAFMAVTAAMAHADLTGPAASFLRFVLQPALAIALAAAMYRYLEAPLSAWVRSALIRRKSAMSVATVG